jgi:DNA segregation ATPase FtsK/SpoIIIE, S-DNA-T family
MAGHQAELLARQALAAQLAGQLPGQFPGQQLVIPGQLPAAPPRLTVPRPAWRFRKHAQPFAWLALLLAGGAALHAAPSAWLWSVLAGLVVPGAMWLAAQRRHDDERYVLSGWTRRFVMAQAAATGVWLPLLGIFGVRAWAAWVLLAGLPFLGLWVRHYRWRPDTAGKAEEAPPAPEQDRQTWAELAAEHKWRAELGPREDLPGGGRRYPVQCDGIKTTIDNVLGAPAKVSGAWHKPMTEAYAERDPSQITSKGFLTILGGSSLTAGRTWDGQGMDPATGTVCTGRFADGRDALEKWYEPRYGCYHTLVSGTSGSGKSSKLDLEVFIALATGWFVPVILDPQEGQSLPFWRERCIYASGAGQVERRLHGLYEGFMDRSGYLGTLRWTDQTPAGPVDMPGMPFFDYAMTGLPMVLIILDEAHLVLKDGSKYQRQITAYVVEMARLIRKAGGKMVLATQLPGLKELGGEQALRDMLRGGTVWSGRTANSVASGMLGLTKDPSLIPRRFPDGRPTAGLGYLDGFDARPDTPMRVDLPGPQAYAGPPPVPRLDDRFLEVMDRAMRESVSPTSGVAPVTASPASQAPASGLARLRLIRSEPAAPAEPAEPEGQRCEDAVWMVLTEAGGPVERGEIISRAGGIAEQWGRDKCWSIRQIGQVLRDMTDGKVPGRQVLQPVKSGPYQAATE